MLSLCLSAGAAKLNSPSAGGRQEEGCCDYRVGGARIKAVSNPSPGVLTRAAGKGQGREATMQPYLLNASVSCFSMLVSDQFHHFGAIEKR